MSSFISYLHYRLPVVLLMMSLVVILACGKEDSPAPTILAISTNAREVDEGDQFAIILRTDTPNRTGTDFSIPLIFEGIDTGLIDGSGVTPVIQQDQEFNSILIAVADDPDVEGDRALTVSIDPSQVPSGLTLGNAAVTITITDK